MACKIWTKGITWKKTAIKLFGDVGGPAFTNGNVDMISKPCAAVDLHNIGFSFQQSRSLITSQHLLHPSPRQVCGLRSLRTDKPTSFFSCSRSLAELLSQIRESSTSTEHNDGGTFTSAKPNAVKVGIISSMFEEGPKAQQYDKEEQEQKEEKKKDDKESAFLRSQRIAKWILLGTFAVTTPMVIMEFGPPKRDDMGNIIPDEYSNLPTALAYLKRSWGEIKLYEKDIVEPSSQKLLPDPLQEPYYQPPYTLVIELFDVLLHPVYDQVHGWRFKKRPGIDYFLQTVGPPLYEIVIFTRETGMTAFPLIDSMDPKGYIMYRLFRDAARFKSGFKMGNMLKGEFPKLDPYYQKDLTYLNRDLRRVVMVDNDKRAAELQPNNGISLKPWDGSSTDTELYDLAAFLRTVATSEVNDVRPVLEHYRKYEDPLAAFKLAQTRMQEEQEKLAKQLQENKTKPFGLTSQSGGFNMLTKYFRPKN